MYDYTFEILSPGGHYKSIYGRRDTSILLVASGKRNEKGEYDMVYINQNWGKSRDLTLLYIPKKERTYDDCLNAIKNKLGLTYVPEHLRTKEICILALTRNKADFSFVPEKFHSDPDFSEFKKK